MDVDNVMMFLEFVKERHRVWERRQAGEPAPWTTDPILARRKFTNVFRVLDPGSQFPLRELYLPERRNPMEVLARAWLYRHTNLPAPWEAVRADLRGFPLLSRTGGPEAVYAALRAHREAGNQWSSGAYILRPESVGGKHVVGGDKLEFFTRRCREIFLDGRWNIARDFFTVETTAERHAVLTRPEGIGDFMALQILTDFHYALDVDHENDFVVLGPGSTKGLAHLGLRSVEEGARILWADPDCPRLNGRLPSLMDIQNCYCEFSKYVRELSRVTSPGVYSPAHPGVQSSPVLPAYY